MRQYVGLVFDDWVSGLGSVFTPSFLDSELARYEQVAVQAVVTRVGGSSPRLNAMFQHSSNGRHWFDKTEIPAIESATLTAATTNVSFGVDASEEPTLAYARWLIRLEGTAPRAYVRLWMTGRGKGPVNLSGSGPDPRCAPAPWRTAERETGILFRVSTGLERLLARETPTDRVEQRAPTRAPEPERLAR